MKTTSYALGLLCFLALSIAARAQGLGTIVGTLTDPSGSVIPGAMVQVTAEATGASRSTTANSQGYYVIPSLQPARYELTVELAGFSKYVRKAVTLLADQSLTINVALNVQQASEAVTVEAAPSQVNTTTSTLSEVVDQKRIIDLPLNGRNAATLTLLVAGAVQTPSGGANQGITKTFPGAVTISTNGSRGNQISYQLDGGNNYTARYGQNAGGVVNIITKPGGNELRGDAFEFVRNAVFNARNFFAARSDQLKRNQFGGTIGGPVTTPGVYRGNDKTFFFAGYQSTLIRNISGGLSSFVPKPANLRGDFSTLLDVASAGDPRIGQLALKLFF